MTLPFTLIWQHRKTLIATFLYDLRQRHAASFFGLAWTVLFPILFLGLYSLVFNLILQIRLPGKSSFEYTLIIFSGLIPFLGFSEALSSGVSSLVDNRSLMKGTIFPVELIAMKSVLVSSVTMLVGLALLMGILIARGEALWTQLALPLAFLVQFLFSVGIVWILSIFNVFFRDISNLVSPLILFLMLVSPIGYTNDMIPPEMMPIMVINPLYYMISIYRDLIHFGVIPWRHLLAFGGVSLALFLLGFTLIQRLKAMATDHV
ncbi:ABC transporter permease [Shinella zoogloeoides]|uniref:Transport permease protein n=1 Tax=Shinella zoogloeoides TaxID=352475 RepID=A0A6N8TJ75_SHIZO|nr:ABC transporter permease [Shinella zoogloeoides]MXO02721.1 ABC transporter permease [Shinella zoogloeoides]UEX81829.1 ABC transporter permease [Shinella zoogloeoides]